MLGCKNKAKNWFCQMLSTKTLTLIVVNKTLKKKFKKSPDFAWKLWKYAVILQPVRVSKGSKRLVFWLSLILG